VFNVIDHSGVAERAGVQMPDSKLVMFGKPAVGATAMLAAPLAALDIPLKVLVWEDRNGAVSVSYKSPGFLAGRHCRVRSSVPPAALAFHAGTASRTWAGRRGGITRPSGRISPMSSNTIAPLHSRLHPCSG
jgi:Domain of unknown function DUF302